MPGSLETPTATGCDVVPAVLFGIVLF